MPASDDAELLARTIRAIRAVADTARILRPEHRLIDDLGFDSLKLANLAITLEEELGVFVPLVDWLAIADDPRQLTVGSLVVHIRSLLADGG